jgi:hypothetical protein
MAQNVWNATLDPSNNVKQNSFDWTHVNNLTTQIGRITPIQCELVPAKTSFRVKPFPALQLMPMVFPIQTRMRATISYFRYPLRALWKDFKDFEGNFREGLEEPYHDFNSQSLVNKMLGTGKLMDYLGVPTTFVGDYGSTPSVALAGAPNTSPFAVNGGIVGSAITPSTLKSAIQDYSISDICNPSFTEVSTVSANWAALRTQSIGFEVGFESATAFLNVTFSKVPSGAPSAISSNSALALYNSDGRLLDVLRNVSFSSPVARFQIVKANIDYDLSDIKQAVYMYKYASGNPVLNIVDNKYVFLAVPTTFSAPSNSQIVQDITLSTSPYYNSNSANKDKQLKLSAYAARAYEGIYNSVYRDNRNNPYYIDGVVQYNQWIPSYEGGADSYPYELRYANWEKDFLTTAVQSPQQGNAPLVGITTYEQTAMVTDESGNATPVKQTKVAMVDEDGKRYSLEFESDSDELKDVKYIELDNGTTVRSARSLFDLVTSGISITDLRNVNAYQKFLELNMRKGYSYKEIIEGRFDVKVRYADLLLPEFFGGFSRDINMNAVTQTIDKDDTGSGSYKDALGSQAGIGYFRGGTDANIECFCDEESIIMGLLIITPLPVYTQLLPKHFLYRGLLDHFNPEFNNISFQPITYKEVCPIQAYNENPDSLSGTFGYQRPWYEYCQRYDQAHGLFRTDLSNFLMHRVFDQKPELAQSFLIVDPDQVTDVFSVTETTDKVYGQILLDCTVKLPVARVAIPRLD